MDEAELSPQRLHLVRGTQWPEERTLDRRIEDSGDVPNQPDMRQTAKVVPHSSSHRPTGADYTKHLSDRTPRIGDELQDQHREGAIERIVVEWQSASVRLLEGNARIAVEGTRILDKGFGHIDTGHARDVRDCRQSERQATGATADVENPIAVR